MASNSFRPQCLNRRYIRVVCTRKCRRRHEILKTRPCHVNEQTLALYILCMGSANERGPYIGPIHRLIPVMLVLSDVTVYVDATIIYLFALSS